jgi:SNF2 family DNA or RNA helicase
LVAPFVLRRRKEEVARELPRREEIDVPVVLSPPERRNYEIMRASLRDAMRSADPAERMLLFAGLTRLRQLACHPRLCDPTSTLPSAKLERARLLLRELRAAGRRALVFSQFTSHLDLCAEAFAADGARLLRLDGRTAKAARVKAVDAFQRGEADALLVSLGAGGTGLTLTAADAVVLLDPWWNPALEAQAADRAHRIGQTKPVTIFRLVSQDTVEVRVRELQRRKHAIARDVLAGVDAAGGPQAALDLNALRGLIDDLDAEWGEVAA